MNKKQQAVIKIIKPFLAIAWGLALPYLIASIQRFFEDYSFWPIIQWGFILGTVAVVVVICALKKKTAEIFPVLFFMFLGYMLFFIGFAFLLGIACSQSSTGC